MEAKRAGKMTGRKKKTEKEEDRKLLRLVLGRKGCCDLAGGGETDIISSDCSTSPLPSIQRTNCFLSQSARRHAHKTPSQTEQHISRTSQPEVFSWHFLTSKLQSTVSICFFSNICLDINETSKKRKIVKLLYFFPTLHLKPIPNTNNITQSKQHSQKALPHLACSK